ncbi:MAG: hypothetical protein EYC70_16735 [Planctomycetota bacterium]|nr:MAG: hypothetical protein EYC70_16735 [Planctomycetota bacterium]
MQSFLAPALALLAILAPVGAAQDKGRLPEKPVKEERTGVEFQRTLPAAGGGTHTLVGTGVRTRTIFNVKVYAIGYYVDLPAAIRVLGKYKELKAERLEKNQEFGQDVVLGDHGKTLRLVLVRDVDAEDMREAFEDELQPRLKEKSKPADLESSQKIMDTFRGYFGTNMKEGDTIVFTWQPGGKLYTSVNNQEKGVIESHTLCWALFDIFLGPDAISPSARNNFLQGLHAELRRTAVAAKSNN